MASKVKYIFALVLLVQLCVPVTYLAYQGFYILPTTTENKQIVGINIFQRNLNYENSNFNPLLLKVDMKNISQNVKETRQTSKSVEKRKQITKIIDGRQTSTEIPNSTQTTTDTGNKNANKAGISNLTVTSDLQKQLTDEPISVRLPTNTTSRPDYFQPIDDKEAWLYSAFFDHVAAQNGKPLVRVVGLAKINCPPKVYCTFTSDGKNFTSTGEIKALPDAHWRNYPAVGLECPLPNNERPTHVSVSFKTTNKPTNRLQIIYPGPRIRNFTVCYSVLHSGYNKPTQIIESIEMNRILGAEHFMIYSYSISPAVDQILRRYQNDGLVTFNQWPIPTLETWYFGQMTALSDCFYRNRNTSRFVVVVDTDELIVPRSNNTWMELIHNASPEETDVSRFMNASGPTNRAHNLTGCFMIRSSFFSTHWTPKWDTYRPQFIFGENERKNILKYHILSLSQLWRTEIILPPTIRSKYIARPELVYNAGIHYVHNFTSFTSCLVVNESLALLHHYRWCSKKQKFVDDTSTLGHKETLYTRIMEQIKQFPNIFS